MCPLEKNQRLPASAGNPPATQPQVPHPECLGRLAEALRRHSALEDLGPLFGDAAQGHAISPRDLRDGSPGYGARGLRESD